MAGTSWMKRTILLLTVVGTAVLLATGVALAAGTLDQQQTNSSGGGSFITANQTLAQTFTAGLCGKLDKVSVYVARFSGDPNASPGNLVAEIRTVDAQGAPTATVLASEAVSSEAVSYVSSGPLPLANEPGAYPWVDISMTSPASVTAGSQYVLVLRAPTAGSNNQYYIWPTGGSYSGGGGWYNITGVWGGLPGDFPFKTYVDSTSEDCTRPDTSISGGPNGPTSDDTPTFTFSRSDNVTTTANLKYSYKVDGGSWSTTPSSDMSVTLPSLSEGNHTFYVKAIDEAGNEDDTPAEQSFTVDKTAPTVLTVGPLENAPKVARSTNITATFSEEKIDTNTLTSTTVKLEKVGAGKKGTVTYTPVQAAAPTWALVTDPRDGTKQVLKGTLDPTSNLDAGAAYRATVTTEVKDEAGNALAQAKVWNFKAGGR